MAGRAAWRSSKRETTARPSRSNFRPKHERPTARAGLDQLQLLQVRQQPVDGAAWLAGALGELRGRSGADLGDAVDQRHRLPEHRD